MTATAMLVLFAVGWIAITGAVTVPNLVFGALIGAGLLVLLNIRIVGTRLRTRTVRLMALGALFVRELIVSALQVARLVVTPNLRARLRPAIIAYPLTVTTDAEITLLANLITLTPGTLSIDVSADRRTLYVHAIDVDDQEAFVRGIAEGFERQVERALQ